MESISLAILLGASEFPYAKEFPPWVQFRNTHDEFVRYLTEVAGVGPDLVLDLFDSPEDSHRQIWKIHEFLDAFDILPSSQNILRNLFIVYIGHGIIRSDVYYVAVRSLRTDSYHISALNMRDLGMTLSKFKRFRKFVFLDSCFAAKIVREWLAPADEVVGIRADLAFGGKGSPEPGAQRNPAYSVTGGTTIFCAADQYNPALSPKDMLLTMFGNAVLTILRTGSVEHIEYMSMTEIAELTIDYLKEHHAEEHIRPVVHSPHQPQGDIREIKIFKNFRYLDPSRTSDSERMEKTHTAGRSEQHGIFAHQAFRLSRSILLVVAALVVAASIRSDYSNLKDFFSPSRKETSPGTSPGNSSGNSPGTSPGTSPGISPGTSPGTSSGISPGTSSKNSLAIPQTRKKPNGEVIEEKEPVPLPDSKRSRTWAQLDFDARCAIWKPCANTKFLDAECKSIPQKWDDSEECKASR